MLVLKYEFQRNTYHCWQYLARQITVSNLIGMPIVTSYFHDNSMPVKYP